MNPKAKMVFSRATMHEMEREGDSGDAVGL
jgi:hypothetical protein